METVVIDSSLLLLREREVLVEMKMWNERKDKIKSVFWSNFVHINMKSQKPENHSKYLMELFKPYENPLPQPLSFDERVEQLKSSV